MKKYKIELVTLTDVNRFIEITSKLNGNIYLTNGNGLKVSARSLLGALYSLEWDNLYVEFDEDIYTLIKQFIID